MECPIEHGPRQGPPAQGGGSVDAGSSGRVGQLRSGTLLSLQDETRHYECDRHAQGNHQQGRPPLRHGEHFHQYVEHSGAEAILKNVDEGKGEKSLPVHAGSEYPATVQPERKQDATHEGQPVGQLVMDKQIEKEIQAERKSRIYSASYQEATKLLLQEIIQIH